MISFCKPLRSAAASLRQTLERFFFADSVREGVPVLVALLTQLKTPLAVIDSSGTIILSSTSLCELLALCGSRLNGLNIVDLFHPNERERIRNEITLRTQKPDQTSALFLTGITRDGRHIPLSLTFSPVLNSASRFLIIFEDKSDEQKDRFKIEKLEHQAAIGTFTSGVAHEFNNVLAGIRGYAQLAKSDIDDRQLTVKAFAIIEQETVRGAELCKNLSLYSGSKKLSCEPVILQELVQTAVDLQSRYLIADNIRVTTDIAKIPPVLADKFKLQQVILNLLINARHAIIPKGSGEITIQSFIDAQMVAIRISDTGTGIEPHNISRIFDPFYTSKNTPAAGSSAGASIRGTGLGLSVCQTIIKQHDGTIDVTSQPGIGTSFTVRIPFRIAERRNTGSQSVFPPMPDMKKKTPRILVVDDEMSVREILYRALIPAAEDVSLAVNADECRTLVESSRYDIILLDYILPDMNADRLLPVIREANPEAKIIIISGWNSSPVKKAAIEKQVDGWIDKPFNMDALMRKIAELS